MLWVGLTGGIASGKSTVSRMLREMGAFIIDADTLAHAMLRKGAPAYLPVVQEFGETILDENGEIDRAVLGEQVFGDAERRRALERLVHPHIFRMAETEKAEIARQHPNGVIVFDAALLIETGSYLNMDCLLLVYVDRPTQVTRLRQRDGIGLEAAQCRIDAQMPLDEKVRYATFVIDNMKSREETRAETERIYARMAAAAVRESNGTADAPDLGSGG